MSRTLSDFEVVMTTDGSPSLRIKDDSGYVEKMHHTAGALSETLYIYGEAIAMVLDKGWDLHVLSLGLGLGYNEMVVAAEVCKRGQLDKPVQLFSFESEALLADSFGQWVNGHSAQFAPLYQAIAECLERQFGLPEGRVVQWLRTAMLDGRWEMRGPFPAESTGIRDISCVLYDAFSNKMCPELWSEDVINRTAQLCSTNAIFATYAVTGNLKRALKAQGFERIARPGFSGKRESTLAVRAGTL